MTKKLFSFRHLIGSRKLFFWAKTKHKNAFLKWENFAKSHLPSMVVVVVDSFQEKNKFDLISLHTSLFITKITPNGFRVTKGCILFHGWSRGWGYVHWGGQKGANLTLKLSFLAKDEKKWGRWWGRGREEGVDEEEDEDEENKRKRGKKFTQRCQMVSGSLALLNYCFQICWIWVFFVEAGQRPR